MNAKRSKTIKLFISYSHLDRKYLIELRKHLSILLSENNVQFWWDGELVTGQYWEPQLINALHQADIIVLLLTANFFNSEYIINKELQLAREMEKKGHIDLLPIWVNKVDLGIHWLGDLQAIKVNNNFVVQSHRGDAAWASVAEQIRQKVNFMRGKNPVSHSIYEHEEVVNSGNKTLTNLTSKLNVKNHNFQTVSMFWKAKSTILPELHFATVNGTLSQFAPMLMGPPSAKRMLHREFRKAIETHRGFGERKRLTINACMSISAGQMVHLEKRSENNKRLIGLYESIARNSIPIFVLPEYYDEVLVPLFLATSGSGCIEVSVTGRLFELDNNFVRRFLTKQGMDKIISPYVINELCRDAYALEVGGPVTKICPLLDQTVRYLDGDIWIAAKSGEEERFFTGFVDLTNQAERDEEKHRLLEEAGNCKLIATYDQLQSISQIIQKKPV